MRATPSREPICRFMRPPWAASRSCSLRPSAFALSPDTDLQPHPRPPIKATGQLPEPSTVLLVIVGVAGLRIFHRRRS
ncbi:MAG: PEP-CTERM sorting domain-containing protein [Lentisphaerae bacterium]|nr:PEP-CTERM sorting domain-containing protein [Lentisphaerota bacterium]